MRQEAEDLEQCRVCFAAHLDKIQKINPENWSRDNLRKNSKKPRWPSTSRPMNTTRPPRISKEPAAARFSAAPRNAAARRAARGANSEFMVNLRNGFAFNLPIVVLGGVALLVYLVK